MLKQDWWTIISKLSYEEIVNDNLLNSKEFEVLINRTRLLLFLHIVLSPTQFISEVLNNHL